MALAWSVLLFTLAGLCEIGGGYLVWLWLREGRSPFVGLLGAVVLIAYGVVATWQPHPHFGRVYAAYGGIFVAMSLAWAWRIDRWSPDRFDLLGAVICLAGAGIILWGPRP